MTTNTALKLSILYRQLLNDLEGLFINVSLKEGDRLSDGEASRAIELISNTVDEANSIKINAWRGERERACYYE